VDNLAVRPLVKKTCAGGLKARTVTKYVEYVKQVIRSTKARNGEPVHKRTWDAETMDLPVVKYRDQMRPALKAKAVSQLIADSEGQERTLNVLLASTWMRISEALAVESRHFINNGRTVIRLP
jgi:integrase